MKELKEFDLIFENGRQSFCGGEIMRGRVIVHFEDPAEMKNIQIRFYGEAFSQANTVHASFHKPKNRKKESVVDLQKILFGLKDGAVAESIPTHPHGVYSYDFHFMVPRYLPCSFESPEGKEWGLAYIRYFVEATITRPWRTDVVKQLPVNVNEVIDTALPEYSYRPGCQTQRELGTCLSDGILSIEAYLDDICYNQGDSILITCEAENDSNRIMTSVYAKLFRRTRYRRKKETKTYLDVVAEYFGDRILPRKSVNWNDLKFQVPIVGPTITKSHRVNVDYFLRVGMYQLFRDEIHVDLPIVIGTTKQYLLEKRLTEEELQQDLSVTVDPVAAREIHLEDVDRQKLEDIADIFMQMPHAGKRPSVQYISALARKNRRQRSVESTPRKSSQYDSDASFIGDERAQMSRSADLLQSGYYEDPAYLSPSGLSSRRASETNLYSATRSSHQHKNRTDGNSSRPSSTTPTPRPSLAGMWSRGNTPRQNDKTDARPTVRKAVSQSAIGRNRSTTPEFAGESADGQRMSPRKSPAKRPTARKTASQGKVDMKEAAMIAAGLGNIRRKGGLKIKGHKDGGGETAAQEGQVPMEQNSTAEEAHTDMTQMNGVAGKGNVTTAALDQNANSVMQNGSISSGTVQSEAKQRNAANRLKSSLKKPMMSPIHSAAESGTESPNKEVSQKGSTLRTEKKLADSQKKNRSAVANSKVAESSKGSGVKDSARKLTQKESLSKTKSKLSAMSAFKKGSRSTSVGNSKKQMSQPDEKNKLNGDSNASSVSKTSKSRKISSSEAMAKSTGNSGAKSKENDALHMSLTKDEARDASNLKRKNSNQIASEESSSLPNENVKEQKNGSTNNNNVGEVVEDDFIAAVNEQSVEQTPDFDFEDSFGTDNQNVAETLNENGASKRDQNEASNLSQNAENENDKNMDGKAKMIKGKLKEDLPSEVGDGTSDSTVGLVSRENDKMSVVNEDQFGASEEQKTEEQPLRDSEGQDEALIQKNRGRKISENNSARSEMGKNIESKDLIEESDIVPAAQEEGLEEAPSFNFDDMDSIDGFQTEGESASGVERDQDRKESSVTEEGFTAIEDHNLERAPSLDEFEQFEAEIFGNGDSLGEDAQKEASSVRKISTTSESAKDNMSQIDDSEKEGIEDTKQGKEESEQVDATANHRKQSTSRSTKVESSRKKSAVKVKNATESDRSGSEWNRKKSTVKDSSQSGSSKKEAPVSGQNGAAVYSNLADISSRKESATETRKASASSAASISRKGSNVNTSRKASAVNADGTLLNSDGNMESKVQDDPTTASPRKESAAETRNASTSSAASISRKGSNVTTSRKASVVNTDGALLNADGQDHADYNAIDNSSRKVSVTAAGSSTASASKIDGSIKNASRKSSISTTRSTNVVTSRKESMPSSNVSTSRKVSTTIASSEGNVDMKDTLGPAQKELQEKPEPRIENGYAMKQSVDERSSINSDERIGAGGSMAEDGVGMLNGIDVQVDMSKLQGMKASQASSGSMESGSMEKQGDGRAANEAVDINQNGMEQERLNVGGRMAWRKSFAKIRSATITDSSRRRSVVNIKIMDDKN